MGSFTVLALLSLPNLFIDALRLSSDVQVLVHHKQLEQSTGALIATNFNFLAYCKAQTEDKDNPSHFEGARKLFLIWILGSLTVALHLMEGNV